MTMSTFAKRVPGPGASPAELFNKLDFERDGVVFADELIADTGVFKPSLTTAEALAAVKLMDTNFDNHVTLAEFSKAIEQSRSPTEVSTTGATEASTSTMTTTTTTSTATVWKPKRQAMTSNVFADHLLSSHNSTAAALSQMDADGDGCLTEGELISGVAALRQPLTKQEAQYAFSGLDANGDLFVCRQEFMGVLRVGRFFQTPATLEAAGFHIGEARQGTEHAPKESSAPVSAKNSTKRSAANASEPVDSVEVMGKPISLAEFTERMGPKVPPALHALDNPDGCVDLKTFRNAAAGFDPPLSKKEADYAFCGMDGNHDKKVCAFEFFGTLKIGHFFVAKSHFEHLKEVGALPALPGSVKHHAETLEPTTTTSAPTTTTTATANLPSDLLDEYMGVPAIVSGHAEITLRVSSDSPGPTGKEQKALSAIFKRALEHQFGLDVNVADIESVHLNGIGDPRDKTLMILWTAGTIDDGGALQKKLQEKADDLQKHVEKGVDHEDYDWLEHASLWAKVSLSYYGPTAARLPSGSRLAMEIGTKVGPRTESQ